MNRLKRWLFNGLAAVSLILCLGLASLWLGPHASGTILSWERWSIAGPNVTYSERWVFCADGNIGIAKRSSTKVMPKLEIPATLWMAANPRFEWTLGEYPGMGGRLYSPLTHGLKSYDPHGRKIPVGNYSESTLPAGAPITILATLPILWFYRNPLRRWPTWKSLLIAHSLASYLVWVTFALLCGESPFFFTPRFWAMILLAPLSIPYFFYQTWKVGVSNGIEEFLLVAGYLLVFYFTLLIKNRHLPDSLRGICQACGYDLRATPDRCPECGTIPFGNEIVLG